jgi:hypothetical protein
MHLLVISLVDLGLLYFNSPLNFNNTLQINSMC